MSDRNAIVLENAKFRLELSPDGTAESLILKSKGIECLFEEKLPFCTLTEERPYHNEVKLAHLVKKTTFGANRLRMENGELIVGFELIDFEAVLRVEISERYMIFSLKEFIVRPDSFGLGVVPMQPPVLELRLVQLPLSDRARFGEWLNVVWDDEVAVNVLGASPYAKIGAESRPRQKILFGESLREVQLKNTGVALIVSEPDELLDAIETLEIDRDLPRGVASRRSGRLNNSYYWTASVNPDNVDEHIRYAKKGGFRYMLIYYSAMLAEEGGFKKTGVYDEFRPQYPNGTEDIAKMLEKIRAAGITPGLHILHTHIGMRSRYLTPVADHRIHLTRHFTLAQPLEAEDTTVYVEENPDGVPLYEKQRVLGFMGELISYESYTTERPYCFVGCKRGYNDTAARAHERGTIGGILDISEFCANSAYIDQNTGLQDEIAEQIEKIYRAGFEFIYFDGSEGAIAPFDIHVALAQWRVYRRLEQKPIFCEGAAKSHFSWHMLSGGNAFDVWKPDVFKKMIALHPYREAQHMKNDFTRVNFGWWSFGAGQRADILEYGTALAASCDCPGALQTDLRRFREHPRTDDIFEVLRRWEEAREIGFVTPEIKAELRKTEIEHTLLINEEGGYELAAWEQVKNALGGDERVTVFLLERKGKCCAVCWNNIGDGHLSLPIGEGEVSYVDELGGEEIAVERKGTELIIPIGKKRYLITDLNQDRLAEAFAKAKLV